MYYIVFAGVLHYSHTGYRILREVFFSFHESFCLYMLQLKKQLL